jgi:hypothetical protein
MALTDSSESRFIMAYMLSTLLIRLLSNLVRSLVLSRVALGS